MGHLGEFHCLYLQYEVDEGSQIDFGNETHVEMLHGVRDFKLARTH